MSGTLPSPLLPSRVGSGRTQGLPVTRLLLCQHLKELPNMLCVPLAPHLPVARPREAVPTAPLRGPPSQSLWASSWQVFPKQTERSMEMPEASLGTAPPV